MAIYKTYIEVTGTSLDIEVNHNESTINLGHESGLITLSIQEACELINSLSQAINLLTI